MSSTADVAVVGAGAIGATIAWRCAQRGLRVIVIDPDARQGAWWTAAGMLAPITELHYAETELLRLNLAALQRYPGTVDELRELTGIEVGYRTDGALSVAWDGADLAALRDLHEFGTSLGLPMQLVSGAELRELEPGLAPGLPGGLLAGADHQVDPRALHQATVRAATAAGADFRTASASITVLDDRVIGVRLADGSLIESAVTVLAAGAWSATIAGLPDSARPSTRPVKGQTLRLSAATPLRRIVRGAVAGTAVYIVPRGDGRVVVGATTEETGFAMTARAGAVYELLRDAQTLVPELGEAHLDEICTGLRPGSPDNAPLIGPGALDGLIVATGHHRNGILLAPLTAEVVADLIQTGELPAIAEAFRPDRVHTGVTG